MDTSHSVILWKQDHICKSCVIFFLTPMYMYMCLLNAVHASLSLSYVHASKCEVYDFCFCVGIVRHCCYHWIFHCSRATLGAERVSGESTCTCVSPYQPTYSCVSVFFRFFRGLWVESVLPLVFWWQCSSMLCRSHTHFCEYSTCILHNIIHMLIYLEGGGAQVFPIPEVWFTRIMSPPEEPEVDIPLSIPVCV